MLVGTNKIIIDCFADESGQDTKGKVFVVCTAIILSANTQEISERLIQIENESGKLKKWYEIGDKRRHKYIQLLLKNNILKDVHIFYSIYSNKQDYLQLVGSHVAKAVLSFTGDQKYLAKIFIDKTDKKTMNLLKREIKLFHIKYRKIKGLSDQASPLIRLADAVCGVIRDLDNKNASNGYKKLLSRINEV